MDASASHQKPEDQEFANTNAIDKTINSVILNEDVDTLTESIVTSIQLNTPTQQQSTEKIP